MVTRDRIEQVLDRVRPYLVADGGNIELVDVAAPHARVRLTGMCAGCPSAYLTLHLGVEAALREAMSDFGRLEMV
jgi:Fe-S cluster biogenesis protein NfuA